MRRVKSFALSFASSLLLVSCATTEVPDFSVHVLDPYKNECYGIQVVPPFKEVTLPKEACLRGVILFSKDYAKIKKAFYKNCLNLKCKQSVRVLDEMFLAIDKAAADVASGAR